VTHDAHLEIEAKVLVPDLDAVRARLEADVDARCVRARVHEYNIRYEDTPNALTPAGIVLRLRRDRPTAGEENDRERIRLTYKAPTETASVGLRTRFEAEVDVSDFETMDLMLRRLGYHPSMIYEKYRTTYALAGAEVVLDEMPFGPFVEVEGEPQAIETALARLGLHNLPRISASYADLFERARAALDLTFRDLTFDNFAGIAIPPHLFGPERKP
jgi:adenylate cyclase class 2